MIALLTGYQNLYLMSPQDPFPCRGFKCSLIQPVQG